MRLPLLIIALASLSCGSADDRPEPLDPPPHRVAAYIAAVDRFVSNHTDEHGNVFTLRPDGSKEHLGESIMWASISLAYLPCEKAEPIFAALYRRIVEKQGFITRAHPLPEEYRGRELNFDGKTALTFGLAAYAKRCPADTARVSDAFEMHEAAISARGGELYPGSGEKTPDPYRWTEKALLFRLGLGDEPDISGLRAIESTSAGWAAALHIKKDACYRVHLGYRHLRAAEFLGYEISKAGRNSWCLATRGMGIPNVEWWCARGGLEDYIESYEPNAYEFRHQRCAPPWESPDGNGDQTPGLDLIEAIAERYDLSKVEGL